MTFQKIKAIDYLRMGSAPEAHELTLRSMLQLAKNSHFARGYRRSPEALLIERILRLRVLLEQGAGEILVEKEKGLISSAVAILAGANPEGFALPAHTPIPLPERSPAQIEQDLQELIKDLQQDGTVDEEGYFTEDPN